MRKTGLIVLVVVLVMIVCMFAMALGYTYMMRNDVQEAGRDYLLGEYNVSMDYACQHTLGNDTVMIYYTAIVDDGYDTYYTIVKGGMSTQPEVIEGGKLIRR